MHGTILAGRSYRPSGSVGWDAPRAGTPLEASVVQLLESTAGIFVLRQVVVALHNPFRRLRNAK